MSKSDNLVIISTRLPVTISKKDGKLKFSQSSGGLATGMSTIGKSLKSIWVGWPGIANEDLTQKDKAYIITELKKYKCSPVFLSKKEIDEYYSGYSNATLWPLFHYFVGKTRYETVFWEQYKRINHRFAKEAKQFINANTQVWVHDYQLMLLPTLIREHNKDSKIGFFLHTPFPSFEIFRQLPQREELLRGLLGADLIGFHTYDYVRHYLSSVRRILGYESYLGSIDLGRRVVKCDSFPISIDYAKYANAAKNRNVKKLLNTFRFRKEKTKVIFSVDRLDYSKGIPARLDSYELFLRQFPEYLGKVQLVIIAVPSREDVQEYKELRTIVEQKVSRINGEFSTVDWAPISYRHQSLSFDELSALYSMADVMLVTPLRDGMNLVAKEYIANHHKDKGVLVLSEMAGVASEMPEAILVNPNNADAVAVSIKQALEMPVKEQKQRMRAMQTRLEEYDINKWAKDFITQLDKTHEKSKLQNKHLSSTNEKHLINDYHNAQRRLILLDYDGTLKEFVVSPKASLARPSRKVLSYLKKLSKDPANKLIIVSGRPKNTLEGYFRDINLGIVAEHGGWVLDAGGWVKTSVKSKKWVKLAKEVINEYTARTPGSSIEEKDFALVWHFRQVQPELAFVRAQQLRAELRKLLVDSDMQVFEGNKIIEVKPTKMHKGAIVTELLDAEKWDFIMAIGDDYTDENMFRALPERAYTIQVGNKPYTKARYQVSEVQDVVALLGELIN